MPGSSYFLKPIQAADAPMLLAWRNADHVRNETLSGDVIDSDRHAEWIKKNLSLPFPMHYVFSSIHRPLGIVGVKNLDEQMQAEWGFHFGVTDAPKGAATTMLSAFLKLVFEHMKLNRVNARVITSNAKSIYLHKKLGFIKDNVKSGEINRHGTPVDVIYYHYDAEQWRSVRDAWLPITSNVAIEVL